MLKNLISQVELQPMQFIVGDTDFIVVIKMKSSIS